MAELGNTSELEAELIKRNREIARVRDDVLKAERRLEESQMRNDDLLEKVAELDAEVTKKTGIMKELEDKVSSLEALVASHADDMKEQQRVHKEEVEGVRADVEANESTRQKAEELNRSSAEKVQALEAEVERLQTELKEEQHKHCDTKASLAQSESSGRDLANRSVEQRRQIEELRDDIQQRSGLSAEQTNKLEEERAKLALEVERLTSNLEEHKVMREDLEDQMRTDGEKFNANRDELERLQNDMEQHLLDRASLEAVRDQLQSEYEEQKKQHEDILQAERRRAQEQIDRTSKQYAALDGRLDGQRLMLQEASQALAASESREAEISAQLKAELAALSSEHELAAQAWAQEQQDATRDAESNRTRYTSELETAEVLAQRHARAEIDVARQAQTEMEERHHHLETRFEALKSTHEQADAQQSRQQESLKSQIADFKQRLTEAEERIVIQQQEKDTLKKDLEEAKQEAERASLSHRSELERFQQTSEAETQSRLSAENVTRSKLEEKDTLLQHRDSAIERLTGDVESARKKIAELEDAATKAQENFEAQKHALNLRNAQLEGELKTRQERITEVEGRLDGQRQYLEQLNDVLSKAQTDRDALIETKSSLESQLKLESTQKDAVSASLQQTHDEAEKRCRELEEQISQERDAHQKALEDLQRSTAEDLKTSQERQAALQDELLLAHQRCETLMHNKAALQEEVGQHRDQRASLEASLQERRAEQDRLGLELEQARSTREALQGDIERLTEERQARDSKIDRLSAQVQAEEEKRSAQFDEFSAKVQKLDELIEAERKSRQAAELSLTTAQRGAEAASLSHDEAFKRTQEQLKKEADDWREKAEDAEVQLTSCREQIENQRSRAEDFDNQRREMEAQLRGEIATAEARVRRLETEAQRAQSIIDDGKAALAEQQASTTAKIAALEQQLEQERGASKAAQVARDAAEEQAQSEKPARQQLTERTRMAAEELFTRQVDFALDKQRLSGALEESRRTLRQSLGVPSPNAAVDTVRISGLESQLAEERRKSIGQAVALQRAERKSSQLEDAQKRSEEQRASAVQQAREAERQRATLSEDLRKTKLQQATLDLRISEGRERSAMAAAELSTVHYESKYEAAKLRGALDELRFMLKMQGK